LRGKIRLHSSGESTCSAKGERRWIQGSQWVVRPWLQKVIDVSSLTEWCFYPAVKTLPKVFLPKAACKIIENCVEGDTGGQKWESLTHATNITNLYPTAAEIGLFSMFLARFGVEEPRFGARRGRIGGEMDTKASTKLRSGSILRH